MKREDLVARNLRLSAARHAPATRQNARRTLLRGLASLPLPAGPPAARERILLLRPDHLGDALLTVPAVEALHRQRPQAELHALASPLAAGVLERLPSLDRVEALNFPGFSRRRRQGVFAPWGQALQTTRQWRRHRFSAALILRPDHWWGAMVAWMAGIPQRVGFATPETAPFLTHAQPLQREHALKRNLRLVARLTGAGPDERVEYRFPLTAADREAARSVLRQAGVADGAQYVVIHPGTGARLKHWEPERWARVADHLAETRGQGVVFSGSASELELVREVMQQARKPTISLVGKTDIGQLAACYERASLVLGPDSGPLHLAAAVGTATVTLYGPADPVEFGPWGAAERHAVLASPIACRPCRVLDWGGDDNAWHPCLRDISVEQVLAAAREVLDNALQSSAPVK